MTYSQESKDMDNQHDILEDRHSPSTIHVSEVDNACDRPDHKSALPVGRFI